MYSNKDLDSLKKEYLDQDYPDDLNEHVVKYISEQSTQKSKKPNRMTNIYFGIAFVACLLLAILPNALKKYNIDSPQVVNEEVNSKLSKYNVYDNTLRNENLIVENESIISIYSAVKEITLQDDIYNIDKNRGVLIELRDILIEGIDGIDIDDTLKDILLNRQTKFFLSENGNYVILHEDGQIVVDDILKYKIFKSEYVI